MFGVPLIQSGKVFVTKALPVPSCILESAQGFFYANSQLMRAIATQFKGEVFRSRLEAYMYEYFILVLNPDTIEYEPKHYSTSEYVPDLILSVGNEHFAVEIKPIFEKAKWPKYIKWTYSFSNIQYFMVCTPEGFQKVDRYGNQWEGKTNRLAYYQAINNVKHELSTQSIL